MNTFCIAFSVTFVAVFAGIIATLWRCERQLKGAGFAAGTELAHRLADEAEKPKPDADPLYIEELQS